MARFFTAVNASAETKPSFVVILVDDVGYADVGAFGAKGFKTPNLDRMAAEGTRLTDFYVHPVCGVTRAALMTGCYAMRAGEAGNRPETENELESLRRSPSRGQPFGSAD